MLPQARQVQSLGCRIADQLVGQLREQDLAAVRDVAQAGAAVDGRSVVVALTQVGLSGVYGHPDTKWRLCGPRLDLKCALDVAGGCNGITCSAENGEETVAFAS